MSSAPIMSNIPGSAPVLDPQNTLTFGVTSQQSIQPETELKGGLTNYYLAIVKYPQREEQPPYQAECEDIIDALALTPDEANVFKEIWRSANARKGNGKPGHSALYGAQKMVHYSKRILRKREIEKQEAENAVQIASPTVPK
jgi:hypothetical protein